MFVLSPLADPSGALSWSTAEAFCGFFCRGAAALHWAVPLRFACCCCCAMAVPARVQLQKVEPQERLLPEDQVMDVMLCLSQFNQGRGLGFVECDWSDMNQTLSIEKVPGTTKYQVQFASGDCLSAAAPGSSPGTFGATVQRCTSRNPSSLFSYTRWMLRANRTTASGRWAFFCLDDGGANATWAGSITFQTCDSSSGNQLFNRIGEALLLAPGLGTHSGL